MFLVQNLSAQNTDLAPIFDGLRAKIATIQRGYYDISYDWKGALGDDTLKKSGRVYFFRDQMSADSFAAYVFYLDGELFNAFDGTTKYTPNEKSKKIITQSAESTSIRKMNGGNLNTSIALQPSVLDLKKREAIDKESFDIFRLDAVKTADYNALQLIIQDTFLNVDKISPDDPDVGSYNRTYEVSMPDFFVRKITEIVHFTTSPQYEEIRISPLRPLATSATFETVLNLDSFMHAGYSVEVYDPEAYKKNQKPEVKNGDKMPDFLLSDLNAGTINSADIKKGVILLDFWYRSCAPCVRAMPSVDHLHQTYGKRGLTVLGVNSHDKDAVKTKAFLVERNIHYPTILDPAQKLIADLGINAFPMLLLVDAKTKEVLHVQRGFGESVEADLAKKIESLLK